MQNETPYAEALANFECKLVGEMETGDHTIFVGEVVSSHASDPARERLYIVGPHHKLGSVRVAKAD